MSMTMTTNGRGPVVPELSAAPEGHPIGLGSGPEIGEGAKEAPVAEAAGKAPLGAKVTASPKTAPKRVTGTAAVGARVRSPAEMKIDEIREEIIAKQLPPDLPLPIKTILRKLLPDEILQLKTLMEMVYNQAAAEAGERSFQRGSEEGMAEGVLRGKEEMRTAMVAAFKPMIAVVNAADAWVDNRPRSSTDKPGQIENFEAAQGAVVSLVEAVVMWRQTRPPTKT
jgi:flagellar biosynthesis/type III secretory pathway protein FliH